MTASPIPAPLDHWQRATLPPSLVEAAPLAIYALDVRGRVRLWNPAAERIFGWTERDVIGGSDPTFVAAEDREAFLQEVLRGSRVLEREMTRRRNDGARVEVAVSAARLVNRTGEPCGLTVIAGDISGRLRREVARTEVLERERSARAEAEAAERRARFLAEGSALLNGTLDYRTTLDNLARLAVPDLADYCLIDELRGESITRVAVSHAEPRLKEILLRHARQPVTAEYERHPVLRAIVTGQPVLIREVPDGILKTLAHDAAHLERLRALDLHSFMVVPLLAGEETLGALTLAYGGSHRHYDIADLETASELGRRAGVALQAARLYRSTRRAVRARDRLISVVSHDLRNSLATVLLNSSAVLEAANGADVPPPVLEQLSWIARSAEQMNRLISDLLNVSAFETGRIHLEVESHEAARIVQDSAALHAPLATEKGIDFTWGVEPALPPILADGERMQQVLGNLLGNAIKYSPPGASVTLQAELDTPQTVRFVVEDTGPGISARDLDSIFDLYWRGVPGETIRRGGTGLGLAISRAIVEAHGGGISVDSTPGAGSRFHFTIPAIVG